MPGGCPIIQAQSQDDSVVERAFWSGVTISPPLYGADLPASFFDAKLSYGWNLRDLGDLLRTKQVPKIMGKGPLNHGLGARSIMGKGPHPLEAPN